MQQQVPDTISIRERVAPELLLGKRIYPLVKLHRAVAIVTGECGSNRFGKRAQDFFSGDQWVAPALSLRKIAPSFITKNTFSTWRIFCVGSPGTATISASLPDSSVPILSASPKRSASEDVPAFKASTGFIPRSTIW